ncbi:hypothetical protein SAMN05660199_04125 [Klenkia soli]|uniref:Uncharacterized protein n=1 Tax=Klenkia soli TaxID=1052260 RepID=A0A1H0TFL4_9ACTN|nr:hypothetical protein [Klenkia soli]SDP52336.1 hypothetical protein SAMN05660199_04125 [Klenkia soli]
MMSTLVIIGGVLLALVGLLALIVKLSARPAERRGSTTASRSTQRTPGWVVDTGQKHPDAWDPLSQTSTQIRATR